MKIFTKDLRREVERILAEKNISPDELAKITGISNVTIYNILKEANTTTQKGVARKIAEKTNHDLILDGEKIELRKRDDDSLKLNSDELTLLKHYRAHGPEVKKAIMELLKLRD